MSTHLLRAIESDLEGSVPPFRQLSTVSDTATQVLNLLIASSTFDADYFDAPLDLTAELPYHSSDVAAHKPDQDNQVDQVLELDLDRYVDQD